jgi:hypothetical protein
MHRREDRRQTCGKEVMVGWMKGRRRMLASPSDDVERNLIGDCRLVFAKKSDAFPLAKGVHFLYKPLLFPHPLR